MDTALMLLAALGLVILNAMFVAAEFAFVKIRATRLEILTQSGSSRAKAALFGLVNLEDYLSVCQLGITLASLGLGWLGEPAVAALLRPLINLAGLNNPSFIHSLSIVVGFSIITFIHVTLGELAPKNISIRSAESTVLMLAWPMRICHFIFLPAVKILNSAARGILYVMGASNWTETGAHSTEELKMLIAESKDEGQLDAAEERLINNVFNMDKRTARDLMVHRTKVVSLSVEGSLDDAISLIREHGFTRLPIFEDDKDNIIGFIHTKDLLFKSGHGPVTLRHLVRPALYIYDHTAIDDILDLMQKQKTQFGLVWDEYGSWQGILTMEDIIEAIVGDIQDEFDREDPAIQRQPDGRILAHTTVSLDELKEFLPLALGPESEERYRTLAAILADKFGDQPIIGKSWQGYGAEFEVSACDGPAITKVLVKSEESES